MNPKNIALVAVAVVVIGGGAWWWMGMSQTAVSPTANVANPAAATTPTPAPAPAQSNGISMTDNSNAALQADLSNVDSQMNGFSSDNASVNQSLNDQPVPQSQL